MTRKEFSLVSAIIKNVGTRNYEKQRKLKPEEYTGVLDYSQLQELVKEAEDKKLNHYKNKIIKQHISLQDNRGSKPGMTYMTDDMPLPEIDYYVDLLEYPKAQTHLTMGHEMGHAKQATDIRLLQEEQQKLYDSPNPDIRKIKQLNKQIKKKIKLYNNKKNPRNEKKADKNIVPHLKQLGLSKPDRQAHYYHRKYIYPKKIGRYTGILGDVRYLKDHIFGFSEEDDFVKKNKRIF